MKRTKGTKVKGVRASARKDRERGRQERRAWYNKKYNEQQTWRPTSINKLNKQQMEQFFCFPKWIINESRDTLPLSVLAVYPVMCCQADFVEDKWFQISQKNIARMAGVSEPTVRRAVQHLIDMDVLKKQMREGVRYVYEYKIQFIRKDQMGARLGEFFIFHSCIFESGVWAELRPRAKALYLVARAEAVMDYIEQGIVRLDRNRGYDYCERPAVALCRIVQIDYSDIRLVLDELERVGLILPFLIGTGDRQRVFEVYLRPYELANKSNG